MKAIRPLLLGLFLACILLTPALPKDTPINDDQLNARFKDKVLLLRGFYSGKEIKFDGDGAVAPGTRVDSWTLANVRVDDIHATPKSIEITGERQGLRFEDNKRVFTKTGNIRISVARPSPAVNLEQLLAKIFVQPEEDLCPLLSEEWQYYCAKQDPTARHNAWDSILKRHHLMPINSPTGRLLGDNVVPPKPEKVPDPAYSYEARKHMTTGTSILLVVVDDSGHPAALSILQPVGMGLDEEAVKAVRNWVFQPAAQNGKPVQVHINVEVRFRLR